jgi:hypothetical protein
MDLIRVIYSDILNQFDTCKNSIREDISTDVYKCNLLSHLYFMQSITLNEIEFYNITGSYIKNLNYDIHSFTTLKYPEVRYLQFEKVERALNE